MKVIFLKFEECDDDPEEKKLLQRQRKHPSLLSNLSQ